MSWSQIFVQPFVITFQYFFKRVISGYCKLLRTTSMINKETCVDYWWNHTGTGRPNTRGNSVSVPFSPAQISHGMVSTVLGLRPTARAMVLPEIFDVFFMRIIRYKCHNILLICVAFGSDVFIVVHPLDPKDESVDLQSTLPSSDILRAEVLGRENSESVCFRCVISCHSYRKPYLFDPVIRFSAPRFERDVQWTSAEEDFFSEKCKYLTTQP